MHENAKALAPAPRRRLKRVWQALGLLLLLLLVFHRPLLQTIGRRVAIHYAAKENLKLDCRLEGSVFTNLVIRNLRVVPTGPTIVESVDADYIRADYSLLAYWREGISELLEKAEVRTVRVVLNPAKASVKVKVPDPTRRITLPAIFPEKVRIADVSVLVRSTTSAQDFVLDDFDLELNPEGPGELRIQKLQVPALPAWTKLSAATSYAKKKLIISGLVLDEANQIRLLAVDGSRIRQQSMELALESSLAGGTISGSVALAESGKSLQTKTRFVADNVSLDTLRGYLGRPPEFLSGNMDRLEVTCSGAIDTPRSWDGTVSAQVSRLKKGDITFDSAIVRLTAHGGVATIDTAELSQGENKVRLNGTVTLPNDFGELGRSPASLQISGALPDLRALTTGLPQPLAGSATLEGRADIVDATLRAAFKISTGAITWNGGSAEAATALVTATKLMPPAGSEKVYYADLQSKTNLDLTNVRQGDYGIDSVHAAIRSEDDLVTVEEVLVMRAQNSVTLRGTYRLPIGLARFRLQPGELTVSVNAVEVGDFWAVESPDKITGPLQVDGQVGLKEGFADGLLSLYSSNLRSRSFVIPEVSSEIAIWRNVIYVNDFTASLNESDFARAWGTFSLNKPHRYGGSVSANIADLARFKPLLAAFGNKNELAGSLALDWNGRGEVGAVFNSSGDLKLTLEKGRYANLRSLQAKVEATYAPDGLTAPIVYFGSDKMLFQAVAESNGTTLEISNIQIDQGKAKYATGYISVPFVWKNVGTARPVFDPDGKVAITFQSENLDIKKLFDDVGVKPVGSGLLNVKLDAQGTLGAPTARMELQMRDLRSEKLPQFDPATLDLTAEVKENQLVVSGQVKQSRIQPVAITANLPLNVLKIIEAKKFDENTPVTAKVQLPRSSVNFLRQFAKGVEQLDGDMALDVNVNGTVANPVLSGSGDITVNLMRFSNPTLPALRGFTSRMVFERDTLNFERFNGELAGGPFTISGRVTFPKLTEPNLDFQLKAEAVLVARSDDLTARADADLQVVGPLAAANVTGNVALTNSQFLKNIDLIPIGLPGRPAPRPQPPSDRMLSLPDPPLRDWKFDVAIKTKDPFLIRGNLANGGAIVDLHLGGTGLQPALEGTVRLQNVEATLPFSRMEIAQGFMYFDPLDPLNPKLDLQGVSLIRDYTIRVYVYGTANTPEAVFTSEPPLPQEEIISLLATGTTREELLGGNNVLAGRAAMLLVQQLYRKVFKKGQQTKSNSVFDRLQVDVGNVDPRTGQQSASARFKVNEQFVLVGDLGVQGDFKGTVKYLIRFR